MLAIQGWAFGQCSQSSTAQLLGQVRSIPDAAGGPVCVTLWPGLCVDLGSCWWGGVWSMATTLLWTDCLGWV